MFHDDPALFAVEELDFGDWALVAKLRILFWRLAAAWTSEWELEKCWEDVTHV